MLERNIAAKVIAEGKVNEQPVKVGDVVLVDAHTFRNLGLKKRLVAASPEEAAKAKAAAAEAAAEAEEEDPQEPKTKAKTKQAKA